MYDIAVIGAGPVGSRMAFQLAGLGYRVVVVDKKADIGGPVCCTGIIGRECADSLSLHNNIVFRQTNAARLFSPSGKEVRVWRPEPQATILDRPAFNAAMAARAQKQGAEYRLNTPVSNIAVAEGGASLKLASREKIEARTVVVAAGFAAKLTGMPDSVKGSDFITGAQAEVETVGVDEVEVYFGDDVAPGFFAWLSPTSPNKALVGLLSRRRPGYYLKKLLARLRSEGRIVSSDVEMTHGGIPLQPPERTFDERMVVVGTAAGQVKPTTGGGIYYGLLCADIAAKHLSRGLKSGDLSAASLSRYQRDWQKLLGKELRIGYWARKLYERLNDRQLDYVFDIITSTGIDKAIMEAEDLSFDWHSKVVMRLLGDKALARALMVVKIPFLREKRM
ncbi:MAG: NAD(P)/FAD-dependent oxidoreductase [Dehalococcoidales bacterium]|nr:NAD(P)/FAD-dependent oxidoreductase [Dehalococcoidales bacterium]